jgi:hypothetical protein
MKFEGDAGAWSVATPSYRLAFIAGRSSVILSDAHGEPWADLELSGAVSTIGARDETVGIDVADIDARDREVRISWPLDSTCWRAKRVVITCADDALTLHLEVDGDGALGEVVFLGGWGLLPRGGTGWVESGSRFASLVSGAPHVPGRFVQSARETTMVSAAGGAEPGRPGWFFTPGPLCVSVSRAAPGSGRVVPRGAWLTIGVGAAEVAQGFAGLAYRAGAGSFHLALDYEGHTTVDGSWVSPAIRIAPAADPYAGIAEYRSWLAAEGLIAHAGGSSELAIDHGTEVGPAWWRQPMFCGWGAQCAEAVAAGTGMIGAARLSTQDRYDRYLGRLAAVGVVPGTIAIDDKWEATYGSGEPDREKWPDLRGWIERRHEHGQRVLLWWKAWDAEAFPAEHCVRTPDGRAVSLDPSDPAAQGLLRAAVARMLARDELGADGLKIDFTARTPSGSSLRHHGPAWGIALLRELLAVIRDEAKRVNPDCLLVGQVPEPSLARLLDMIRLNDMLRLDDPEPRIRIVPEMTHRAAIVRAACPDRLVDTDDWCAPDLVQWRAWTRAKPALGVPSLYYVDRLDLSGERLEPRDHALLRRTWARYRGREGLPEPPAGPAV